MVYDFVMTSENIIPMTQLPTDSTPHTQIRHAVQDDLVTLTNIYNHYVINTAITFDLQPFTPATRRPWLDKFHPGSAHQCLVIEVNGRLAGYASSAQLRPKAAYDTSVECSIYLDPAMTGQGHGKQLYKQLLLNLQQQDVHRCYGIITLPNLASTRLHEQLGFTEVARLNEVGRKFDTYWDTLWVQKSLEAATPGHEKQAE
jgi:phosphinothricin acetyltransferase